MAGIIEHTLPRISVNKLGEYMTATPSRRQHIVRDQRRPKGFLAPRYNDALYAIVSHLTATPRDETMLLREMEQWSHLPAESSWVEQRRASCIEALTAFLEIAAKFPADVRFERGPQQPPHLVCHAVSISVRPELIVRGQDRAGKPTVGAIKLYFSKTAPLSPDAGAYVATALADFADQYLALDCKSDYRHCLVVDVFARTIHVARRGRARRRADIAAACDEISRAWATAA